MSVGRGTCLEGENHNLKAMQRRLEEQTLLRVWLGWATRPLLQMPLPFPPHFAFFRVFLPVSAAAACYPVPAVLALDLEV